MHWSSYLIIWFSLLGSVIAVNGLTEELLQEPGPDGLQRKAPHRVPPRLPLVTDRYQCHPGTGSSKQPNHPSSQSQRAEFVPSILDSVVDFMRLPSDLKPSSCSEIPSGSSTSDQTHRAAPPSWQRQTEPRPSRILANRGNNDDSAPLNQPLGPEMHQSTSSPDKRLFLGYRGTTQYAANVYRTSGLSNAPHNRNRAVLGEGLYLTDDIRMAVEYARIAARKVNTKTRPDVPEKPSICTIFANDGQYFEDHIPKVFLPPSAWAFALKLRRERLPQILEDHAQWIRTHVPHLIHFMGTGTAGLSSTIKFTSLGDKCPTGPNVPNQMFIPTPLLQHFSVGDCFTDENSIWNSGLPTLTDPQNKLDYRQKLEQWTIYGMVADQDTLQQAPAF